MGVNFLEMLFRDKNTFVGNWFDWLVCMYIRTYIAAINPSQICQIQKHDSGSNNNKTKKSAKKKCKIGPIYISSKSETLLLLLFCRIGPRRQEQRRKKEKRADRKEVGKQVDVIVHVVNISDSSLLLSSQVPGFIHFMASCVHSPLHYSAVQKLAFV
jgi:hypothetical protein